MHDHYSVIQGRMSDYGDPAIVRTNTDFLNFVNEKEDHGGKPLAVLLGRHGSASLCRDGQENKMAATYNVLAFKR